MEKFFSYYPEVANVAVGTDEVRGYLRLSWIDPHKVRRISVVGTEGMVVCEPGTEETVKLYKKGVIVDRAGFGNFLIDYRTGEVISPYIKQYEPLKAACADFINSIENGVEPLSSSAVGWNVVKCVEACDRSFAAGGIKINVI